MPARGRDDEQDWEPLLGSMARPQSTVTGPEITPVRWAEIAIFYYALAR